MGIRQRTGLLALGGILVTVLTGLWITDRRRAAPVEEQRQRVALALDPAPSSGINAAAPAGVRTPEIEAAASRAPHEEPATARDFLAAYYGERWPEIQAKIQATGQSLDVPYRFTPWEDCAADFARLVPLDAQRFASTAAANVSWPELLTVAWVKENYSFGTPCTLVAEDLPEIEARTAAKNDELRVLGDEFATRVNRHLEDMWSRGTYVSAPFTTSGLVTAKGFHSESHGTKGWAVTLTLTRDDCPDVVEIEDAMRVLRQERDELVVQYLRTKRDR